MAAPAGKLDGNAALCPRIRDLSNWITTAYRVISSSAEEGGFSAIQNFEQQLCHDFASRDTSQITGYVDLVCVSVVERFRFTDIEPLLDGDFQLTEDKLTVLQAIISNSDPDQQQEMYTKIYWHYIYAPSLSCDLQEIVRENIDVLAAGLKVMNDDESKSNGYRTLATALISLDGVSQRTASRLVAFVSCISDKKFYRDTFLFILRMGLSHSEYQSREERRIAGALLKTLEPLLLDQRLEGSFYTMIYRCMQEEGQHLVESGDEHAFFFALLRDIVYAESDRKRTQTL